MNLQQLKTAGFVKGAFIVAGVIALMAFGNYLLSPSDPASQTVTATTPVYTAAPYKTMPVAPRCPGTAQTKTVGSEWVEINPGFRCKIVFNTTKGVSLLGEPENYVEDAPGIQLGNVLKDKGVKVIYAKAKNTQARIEYMLCPHDRGCS